MQLILCFGFISKKRRNIVISKLGAIRTDIKKPVKFVTQKGKDVITDSMQRNGIQWDNLGQISGKRVNAFLDDIMLQERV